MSLPSTLRIIRFLPLITLVASFCLAGCAAERATILQDEWDSVSLAGARAGYVHSVTRQVVDPEPAIITVSTSETQIKRMGIALDIRMSLEFREKPDGEMLSAVSRMKASLYETVTEAVVRGNKIVVTSHTLDKTTSHELPWDKSLIGPYAQDRLLRAAGLQKGAHREFRMYVPEFEKVVESSLTIDGPETVTISGKPMELTRGTMTQSVLPNTPMTVWLDKEGNTVRTLTSLMGGVETLRVTRREALAALDAGQLADVMNNFFIQSNVSIASPKTVKQAAYRIKGDEKMLAGLQLEDRRQTITQRTPDVIFLQVSALPAPATRATNEPGPEFLAASPYLQSDDAMIVKLTKEAVGSAATPAEKARTLERWVNKRIKKKDMSVGFASAKETIRSQTGDCTEHAVLLAAMLRAAGIPSRVAVGVEYWEGIFGYHMWTEAFLNDWTALDATLTEDVVDATHIKFADSALESASVVDPLIGMAKAIGEVKIEVEKVKY